MSLSERSAARRKKIVGNRTTSFKRAEDWDLDFWQQQTSEDRLSALVAIRRDVLRVQQSRNEVYQAPKNEQH